MLCKKKTIIEKMSRKNSLTAEKSKTTRGKNHNDGRRQLQRLIEALLTI